MASNWLILCSGVCLTSIVLTTCATPITPDFQRYTKGCLGGEYLTQPDITGKDVRTLGVKTYTTYNDVRDACRRVGGLIPEDYAITCLSNFVNDANEQASGWATNSAGPFMYQSSAPGTKTRWLGADSNTRGVAADGVLQGGRGVCLMFDEYRHNCASGTSLTFPRGHNWTTTVSNHAEATDACTKAGLSLPNTVDHSNCMKELVTRAQFTYPKFIVNRETRLYLSNPSYPFPFSFTVYPFGGNIFHLSVGPFFSSRQGGSVARVLCAGNDNCSPNRCQNGGTCADGVNAYTCTCVVGYSGVNCQTSQTSQTSKISFQNYTKGCLGGEYLTQPDIIGKDVHTLGVKTYTTYNNVRDACRRVGGLIPEDHAINCLSNFVNDANKQASGWATNSAGPFLYQSSALGTKTRWLGADSNTRGVAADGVIQGGRGVCLMFHQYQHNCASGTSLTFPRGHNWTTTVSNHAEATDACTKAGLSLPNTVDHSNCMKELVTRAQFTYPKFIVNRETRLYLSNPSYPFPYSFTVYPFGGNIFRLSVGLHFPSRQGGSVARVLCAGTI